MLPAEGVEEGHQGLDAAREGAEPLRHEEEEEEGEQKTDKKTMLSGEASSRLGERERHDGLILSQATTSKCCPPPPPLASSVC